MREVVTNKYRETKGELEGRLKGNSHLARGTSDRGKQFCGHGAARWTRPGNARADANERRI